MARNLLKPVKVPPSATEATAAKPYSVSRTAPAVLLRHDIGDEELTMLVQSETRTFEKDILWASIGVAGGALVPALQAVNELITTPATFSMWELAECVILFSGVAIAIVMWVVLWRRPKSSPAADLAQAIRDRTAQHV